MAAAATVCLICLSLLEVHGRQTVKNYCYKKKSAPVSEAAVKVWNGSRLDCAQLFAIPSEGKCHSFLYDQITGFCLNVTDSSLGKDTTKTTRAENWVLIPCGDQRPCARFSRRTFQIQPDHFTTLQIGGQKLRDLKIFLSIQNCRRVRFAFLSSLSYRQSIENYEIVSITLPEPGKRLMTLLSCSQILRQCNEKTVLSNLTMTACPEFSPFWAIWIQGDVFAFRFGQSDMIGKETMAEFTFTSTPPLGYFVLMNNDTETLSFSSTKRFNYLPRDRGKRGRIG